MADSLPFVSVIIPTYNRRDSLLRTLESLARQTYPHDRFEVIVVDDGGNDGSETVCRNILDLRVRYVRQENKGEVVARNRGVAFSQGEILVFLDDDIEVAPVYLGALARAHVEHPHAIILGSIVDSFSEEDRSISRACEPVGYIECMSGVVSLRRRDFDQSGQMQSLSSDGRNIWGGLDIGYRAHCAGMAFWRALDALAIHHDHAGADLESACRRAYRVSVAVHQLFAKYPALQGKIPMFRDKAPIDWSCDGLSLIFRKVARQIASSRPAMALMAATIPMLERCAPRSHVLRLLYRWTISGHIYRGYRTGLREAQSLRGSR